MIPVRARARLRSSLGPTGLARRICTLYELRAAMAGEGAGVYGSKPAVSRRIILLDHDHVQCTKLDQRFKGVLYALPTAELIKPSLRSG